MIKVKPINIDFNFRTIILCLLIIIIILLFQSCATELATKTGSFKPIDESEFILNRLVVNQTGLSLPVGYSFSQPYTDDKEGVLIRFNNENKTIFGSYEYVSFDFKINHEKVAEYYSKEILIDYTKKTITKIAYENIDYFKITAQHDEKSIDTIVVVIPEGTKAVNILEFVSEKGRLSSTPEIDSVIQSYSYENEGKSIRTISGVLEFYCYDGSWAWLDDYENGFYLSGKVGDTDCVVGVWETEYENTKKLYTEAGDFDIAEFDAEFYINNLKVITKGIGHGDDNGFTKIYYIVNYHEKNYCIFISMPKKAVENPLKFHNHDSIVSLFQTNLIFN